MRRPLAASLILAGLLAIPAWGGRREDKLQNLAAAPSEEVAALWDALEEADLGLRRTALVASGTSYSDGEVTYHFDSGFIFRVWTSTPTREDVTAGFAFIGEGRMEVAFQDPRAGTRFANHMVLRGGQDAADFAGVALGDPYIVPIEKGLVFSVDPGVHDYLKTLPQLGGGARGEFMESDVIVVTDTRQNLDDDYRDANRMLDRRLPELRDAGFRPRRLVGRDLLLQERGTFNPERSILIADFDTGRRFRVSDPGADANASRSEGWLTHIRDGSGDIDARLRSKLFIYGADLATSRLRDFSQGVPSSSGSASDPSASASDPNSGVNTDLAEFDDTTQDPTAVGTPDPTADPSEVIDRSNMLLVSGRRFPPSEPDDRLSAPLPAVRPVPVEASVELRSAAAWNRHTLDVELESRLTVAAHGGDLGYLTFSVPREETKIGRWVITQVSDDAGNPLDFVRLDLERTAFDFDPMARVMVFLPEPLAEGEEISVRIHWRDTWDLSNMTSDPSTPRRSLGVVTGFHRIVPLLAPYDGDTAWRYRLRSVIATDARQSVCLSGWTVGSWTDTDWVTTETVGGPATWAGVSIGEWESWDEPRARGMPAIRVNLLSRDRYYLEVFAPDLRAATAFFERLLPKLPYEDIELFQDADTSIYGEPRLFFTEAFSDNRSSPGRFTTGYNPDRVVRFARIGTGVTGGYGNAVGGPERRIRDAFPNLEKGELARQMARQWWGGNVRVAHKRDHWLIDTMSEVYALFFVQAAFGFEAYEQRLDTARDVWERANPPTGSMSLVDAPDSAFSAPIMYHYGPYVLGWTLRRKLGERAFLKALDHFQEEYTDRTVTTEHLLAFLQSDTGVGLRDFFDFWVYGGWLPELNLEYSAEPTEGGNHFIARITTGVPFGAVEVPFRVVDEQGRAAQLVVRVRDGEAWLTDELPLTGKLEVELDPYFFLLDRGREVVQRKPGKLVPPIEASVVTIEADELPADEAPDEVPDEGSAEGGEE
jgi:hypothetical protein